MKIAFVPSPLDSVLKSSIGICTYQTAVRLASRAEVIVYTSGGSFRPRTEQKDGLSIRRLSVRPDRLAQKFLNKASSLLKSRRPLFSSFFYYPFYALQLALDLRKQDCDIVHIHNFSQFVPLIRALNPRIKIVLHMHCEWLTQLDRKVIEGRLTKTDLVIGCSGHVVKKIKDAFPNAAARCRTVYNGVDPEHFTPRKNGRGNGARLLLVGRVSPDKGLHVVIDAFKEISRRFPETRLEIVGPEEIPPLEFIVSDRDEPVAEELAGFYPGSYLKRLKERITPDIEKMVSFAGFVPHSGLADYYRKSDILINSSFHEAFGIPLVEAMSCGLPVVASMAGGIPEVVEDGVTGLLVGPGDAGAVANAVIRLLSNKALMDEMGSAGRSRVLGLFTWDKAADDLYRHYRGLLTNTPCGDDSLELRAPAGTIE